MGRSRLEREGASHRNGTGAVRRLGPPLFAAREEVLEFEPPERMGYRLLGSGLPLANHRGEVRLEPDGEGTRLVWRCRFESRIPGLGGPLAWLIRRFFRAALEGLARTHFPDRA